ncbi:hypothetical protein QE152_g33602 [Popillia japonica]|uniref:MARVEL domain-containing protein n=1 Tax=Popillia japonica TaxID=7064 RepID=A0AAW1IWJ7_POPJA
MIDPSYLIVIVCPYVLASNLIGLSTSHISCGFYLNIRREVLLKRIELFYLLAIMAAPRKSQLFLHSILPVTATHDEVVSDKLKPGKFVVTTTGLIKAAGLIFLLAGITFFLSSGMCTEADSWHLLLFSISNTMALLISLSLYLIFSFGFTVSRPGLWVKTDIISNLILPLLAIILSVVSTSGCSKTGQLHSIPLPLAIAGNVILLFSTGTLFLLYRYREEEYFEDPVEQPTPPKRGRVSIFA